jgi:hypothetical protein
MFKPEHEELKINLQLFNEEGTEDETNDTNLEDSEDTLIDDKQEGNSEEHQEEEYEEIVYNKETVKIPKSEVKTFLQKGYNYDKINGRLTETEQTIKEIQDLTGMDAKAVVEYLKNQKQEQEIAGELQQMLTENPGMTEAVAKRLLIQEQKLKSIEQRDVSRERQTVLLSQKTELKDKPFFKELEADIDKMIAAAPGVDVKTAYNYLRGERFDELLKQAKDNTKKSTIADLHDKAKRGITSSSEGLGEDVDTSDVDVSMARAFGNDPKEIAKYKNQALKRS